MPSQRPRVVPPTPNPPTSAAFVLGDELDALTFDFRTKNNQNGPHGTIPEPSVAQIKEFQSALRKAVKPALEAMSIDPDTADTASLMAAMAEPSKADLKAAAQAEAAIIEAISAVCSGTPNESEISELPYRAQQAFVGWLSGVLLNPSP